MDLPAPLGPSTASTSPADTENSTSKRRSATTARSCSLLMTGYLVSVPIGVRAPTPSTTSAATTTSSSDNATAASGSVTRCR
ncbi:Uncharacterised protein [Mycobacterium tuberculosis]|nr:Uncharacterised protein [Mycobacterium tuberculosis]COY24753.1 Uncharacterised protein [Mycobacterium tuberculosis]